MTASELALILYQTSSERCDPPATRELNHRATQNLRASQMIAKGDDNRLDIRVEDAAWFQTAADEWDQLLRRSSANPLFLSWDWQVLWWSHFAKRPPAELLVITVRNAHGELVGIAPFTIKRTLMRRLVVARQVAPIGNIWRSHAGEVTEHVNWIIRSDVEGLVADAIASFLGDVLAWDELLFANADRHTAAFGALMTLADRKGCYVRREAPLPYYSVDTTRSFELFLQSLRIGTRRQLFGKRHILNSHGELREIFADTESVDDQLDKLDELSKKRWAKGLTADTRGFYRELGLHLLARDSLRFSTLEVDQQPISALFDVCVDGTIYNIRSAIDVEFDQKLSPGLLHMGYRIEAACADPTIFCYDLLAGSGKHTDFKRELAAVAGNFHSVQLVRRTHEKLLYRLYDRLTKPHRTSAD